MTSAIDSSKPTTGTALTSEVRTQFATAAAEITALQALAISGLTPGGVILADTATTIKSTAVMADGEFLVGDGTTDPVLESGATVRTSLGLTIGTDVQAYDAQLADVAGLAVTDGGFIVGDGTNFILETGATALTSIGGIGAATTDTLTNKTLDADGTGNVITNIGSSEIKSEIITGQTNGTVAAGDSFLFSDVDDGGNLKDDTIQGIIDLIPAGATTYESTAQTITAGGSLSLAHGLGAAPKNIWMKAVCQTGEFNWSAGDEYFMDTNTQTIGANGAGASVQVNATNLLIRFGDHATLMPQYIDKTTGASANHTIANWKIKFGAWT